MNNKIKFTINDGLALMRGKLHQEGFQVHFMSYPSTEPAPIPYDKNVYFLEVFCDALEEYLNERPKNECLV